MVSAKRERLDCTCDAASAPFATVLLMTATIPAGALLCQLGPSDVGSIAKGDHLPVLATDFNIIAQRFGAALNISFSKGSGLTCR